MSAGAVQLAAIGQQDAYLTGSPSVSYFNGVYRRNTPFSLQAFSIPFQGQQIQWGSQAVCRVPYKGDLVRGTTLAVTLPALSPVTVDFTWPVSVALQNPIPYLIIDGNYSVPKTVSIGVLDTYSTSTINQWLGPSASLNAYVSYNSGLSKFAFSNCSNVTLNTADVATTAVFFGLDPHSFARLPTSNTVQWDVSPSTIPGPVADFTLSQSGWQSTSSATTPNITESLLMNVAVAVTLTTQNPTSGGFFAQFVDLSRFGTALGFTTLFGITAGGSIKFNYTGSYVFILALNVSAPVARVGVGHWAQDGHPSGSFVTGTPGVGQWAWNDYAYSYLVAPAPLMPMVVLPINVTDITQYYYIDLETQTSAPLVIGDGTLGTEIQITDVNQYLALPTNQTLVQNTINISTNWSSAGFFTQIAPVGVSNAFTFLTEGIYNIRGTLVTSGSNIFSVTLSNATVPNILTWNTTQTRSPTINFTLPVQVTSLTDQYRISLRTDNPATLTAQSWFAVEQIGVPTGTTLQPNSFKKNGFLFTGNTFSQVSTGLTPVNFKQNVLGSGTSRHISVTNGGNIQFSNVGAYKFQAYFETANAYVTSVSLFQSNNGDTRPATPIYQVSSPLNIGTVGPYTIDVVAQCNDLANVFFMDIQTLSPGGLSNITSNAFITVVGVTAPTPNSYQYVDSVGTYLVERAELKIGGQLIQTLTGEAIEIYNDLTVPQENQPGLTLLTGKLDTSQSTVDRMYYVNLPFFFYDAAELSVPICALSRQDMEIYITFRPFASLIATSSLVTQTTVQATVIVEYAYLSNPEVEWMSKHVLDYVITQTQYGRFNLGESTIVDLDFHGPVRELACVVQDSAATPYVYVADPDMTASLSFNGEDFFDPGTVDFQFMHIINPLEKHTRQPNRVVYLYSFARRPQDPRPSGSINMSRIKQKRFQMNLPGTPSLSTKQLRVMATSYNVLRVSDGLAGLLYD